MTSTAPGLTVENEEPFHAPVGRAQRRHPWTERTLGNGAWYWFCPRCGICRDYLTRAFWWYRDDGARHVESVPLCRERGRR